MRLRKLELLLPVGAPLIHNIDFTLQAEEGGERRGSGAVVRLRTVQHGGDHRDGELSPHGGHHLPLRGGQRGRLPLHTWVSTENTM